MKLCSEQIAKLRKVLKSELKNYDVAKNGYGVVELDPSILEQVIFWRKADGILGFAIDLDLIKKLDLTGISFDNVDISCKDFSGSKGARINPQTVKDKNLSFTTLEGVTIIGPFDGCNINATNFTGSQGAKINPQTVRGKNFEHTQLTDAEIIGPFDDCSIISTNFSGSKGTIITPLSYYQELEKKMKVLPKK